MRPAPAAFTLILVASATLAIAGDPRPRAAAPPDPAEEARALERALKKSDPSTRAKRLLELGATASSEISGKAIDALHQMSAKDRLGPTRDLLTRGKPSAVRALAAIELGLLGEKKTSTDLATALRKDKADIVRAGALQSLRNLQTHEELLRTLVSHLDDEEAVARMRSEEALGKAAARDDIIDGHFVVQILVTVLTSTWGGGGHNHVLFANQMAYIADYDVEIAADAVIADPIVATVTDGVVLDSKIIRIEETRIIYERRVISQALANVTGEPLPEDPKKWLAWWEQNRSDFTVFPK